MTIGRMSRYRLGSKRGLAATLALAMMATLWVMPEAASAMGHSWAEIENYGPTGSNSSNAGLSVAISSDGLSHAYGHRYDESDNIFVGKAVVYRQGVRSVIAGEQEGEGNGRAIALSGDGSLMAVGSPAHTSDPYPQRDRGRVRVFEVAVDGSLLQVGADILGEAPSNAFGGEVALSADGSVLAVGAASNDENGVNAGHARVYEWSGVAWVQVGADIDGEASWDLFGGALALSADGSVLAVGASRNDNSGEDAGHIRVFERSGAAWLQVGAVDGEAPFDRFGSSVALSADGSVLAGGAPYNDAAGGDAGHARVFERSGPGWVQIGGDIDGRDAGDRLGSSLALSADGEVMAVGAPGRDSPKLDSGQVRVLRRSPAGWVQVGPNINGEDRRDTFGAALGLSADGSTVIAGAPEYASFDRPGYVKVLRLEADEPPPMLCAGLVPTIDMRTNGGNGMGTPGADVILGTSGDDVIEGRGGDDVICAEEGDDTVYGGSGADVVKGDDGADLLFGGRGEDVIEGGPGEDELHGNERADILRGGADNDLIFANQGNDKVTGGTGDDFIDGGGGNDKLQGGDGNDEIFGGVGRDLIRGNAGDDEMSGQGGVDRMFGDAGNDHFDGGAGNDLCDGGPGTDSRLESSCGREVSLEIVR